MSARSIFAWNPNIGRRSRVNIKTGKSIRKRSDGSELFEDYWTESESDEWTSEEDSASNSKNVETKRWKESTRIEEKESVEKVKSKNSLKEQSPIDSEKENVLSEKNQDCLHNLTEIRSEEANNCIRRDSVVSSVNDDNVRTPSSAKRNVTSSLAKNDNIQTPTSKHKMSKHKISERKSTGSIANPNERRSISFDAKRVLNFSDNELQQVNTSVHQENVTSSISSKRLTDNLENDKVSGNVVVNDRKSFNFVSVNDDRSENANGTRKSFGLSMQHSVFSDSDVDDDENFSFILTKKGQEIGVSKSSFHNSINGIKELKVVSELKKVTEKRKLNRHQETSKYQKKISLSVPSVNSSDNEDDGKYATKSDETIITQVGVGSTPVNIISKKYSRQPKRQNRNYAVSQANSVEDEVEKSHSNSEEVSIDKTSKYDNSSHAKGETNMDKVSAYREKDKTCILKSNKRHRKSKRNNRKSIIPQTNSVEDEVEIIHNNSEEDAIEKIPNDTYISKPNETIVAEVDVGSMSIKSTNKKHSKSPNAQNQNCTILKANSVEDEVERIHNSEKVSVGNISKSDNRSHSRRTNSVDKTYTNHRDRNETVTTEMGVGSMSTKNTDKRHSRNPNGQKNFANNVPQSSSSLESDVENIHNNSEDDDIENNSLQSLSENDVDQTKTAIESNHSNNMKKRKMTGKLLKKKPNMRKGGKYKYVSNKCDVSLSIQNKSSKSDSQKNPSNKVNSENSAESDDNISGTYNNNVDEEPQVLLFSKQNEKRKTGKNQKRFSKKIAIESSSLDNDDQSQDNFCNTQPLQHKSYADSHSLSKMKKRKDEGNLYRKIQSNKLKSNRNNAQLDNLYLESESEHSQLYEEERAQVNEKLKKDKSNRKRKISPVKQNLRRKRNGEVTNAAQSKTNIISPPPVRNPTPGVRRSKRVRVQPLEHWRNQRIHYQKSDSGYIIKGIEQGFDEEPIPAKWNQNHSVNSKYCYKKKNKSTKSSNKFDDISVHNVSALSSNNIIEEPNALIPVICWESGKEILTNVVSIHDSVEWTGMNRSPVSKDDAVAIAVSLRLPNASTGFMRIRAFQEKKLQYLPNNSVLYVILYGKLLIQVNTTTFVLKTGDTFHVPRGNGYSIKNLREDEAELQFTVFYSSEVVEEESDVEC